MNKLESKFSILILTAILLGCATEAAEKPSGSAPSALPVDVVIARAKKLSQEEVVAGSILPAREVTVMSELSKRIEHVGFRDGTMVSAGQVLFKLEDKDIRSRIRQVQAELSLAELNEKRFATLLKNESVRQEEYDAASARLESLRADLDLLLAEFDKTTIRAPFAGRIGLTRAQEGALVTSGMPLVSLQDDGQIKIAFSISEKNLVHVRPGKTIHFSVVNSSARIPAQIIATEASLDADSRDVLVHALASNTDRTIRPGMSARVYFPISEESEKGIKLPTHALIPGAGGYSVFVVKGGVAHLQSVHVANRDEQDALISTGINTGDTVMISNILRAGEGMPVQIVTSK